MNRNTQLVKFSFAAAAESTGFNLDGYTSALFHFPDAVAGDVMTLQSRTPGGGWAAVEVEGEPVTFAVSAGVESCVPLPAAVLVSNQQGIDAGVVSLPIDLSAVGEARLVSDEVEGAAEPLVCHVRMQD